MPANESDNKIPQNLFANPHVVDAIYGMAQVLKYKNEIAVPFEIIKSEGVVTGTAVAPTTTDAETITPVAVVKSYKEGNADIGTYSIQVEGQEAISINEHDNTVRVGKRMFEGSLAESIRGEIRDAVNLAMTNGALSVAEADHLRNIAAISADVLLAKKESKCK